MSSPVPEFREAHQYWQPLLNNDIIRPKPRRLGDMSSPTSQHMQRTPSRERVFGGSPLRPYEGDAEAPGGRTPIKEVLAYSKAKEKSAHNSREASPLQHSCRTPSKELASSNILHQNGSRAAVKDSNGPQLRSASRSSCKEVSRTSSKESAVGGSSNNVPDNRTTPNQLHRQTSKDHCFSHSGDIQKCLREQQPHHAKSSPGLISRISPTLFTETRTSWEQKDIEEGEFSPDGHLSPYMDSMSNTDCGSLSKSSSDGDPIICRRRPPTRLKSKRRNILSFPQALGLDDTRLIQRRHECYGGSSSDENKSSGHASMSDGQSSYLSSSPTDGVLSRVSGRLSGKTDDSFNSDGVDSSEHRFGRGTPLKSVPEDERLLTSHHASSTKLSCRKPAAPTRKPHRTPLEGASGLEDIRQAIEQLSVRTHGSRTSYSTSTYSSMSGSESEPVRRLMRHSSLETINTNITSADEFVWVDNHTRLVELQRVPWSNHDILKVMQTGRLREHLGQISMETVPRLSYLLQRPLVRIARETQRLSKTLGMCTKQEVSGSLKIVLSPALADSCIKACHRSAAISAVSGDQMKLSKSARAGLQLSVGRFHRWMCDVRIGSFVHQYAAIYLTAAIENLLEEIVLQCMPLDGSTMFTATMLETAISNSSDLWGLFQPFSHLNAGRTATGALSLPRWPSQTDNNSSTQLHLAEEQPRPTTCKSMEQHLLTTCVGSMTELGDLLRRVVQYYQHMLGYSSGRCTIVWGPAALHTLYYFMRCSQLEHAEHGNHRTPVQELVYERPYLVLPPLIEWVRVATAHADHRRSQVVDKDDVMQASRLLLPGVDCPIREFGISDDRLHCCQRSDDLLKAELAFRMLGSGRTDLVPHALQLLPHVDTFNEHGLTPLMAACIRGDEAMVHMLLDAGADVDIETPAPSNAYPCVNPETQHWTALTYATTHGQLPVIKLLLEKGANVEGGARFSEEKITVTPLQLAAASGRLKLAELLLSHGAHPFLSTTLRDSLAYGGAAQRGCYSAIAVAGAHGQRTMLHLLLSHPVAKSSKDVLSLEEILAEGASNLTCDRRANRLQVVPVSVDDLNKSSSSIPSTTDSGQVIKLTKAQLKCLQEAMYHSAENGHIDITLDLRNIGVPWTLHCWMNTLAMAYELQVEPVIDQLLQDYLQVWPEDCSSQFVDECLPLLFTIFRHSKKEGTTLLLADIFSNCYSKEPIKEIRDVGYIGGARIDPTYVNNPEMSDVQFRVEGRVFYAHKIILVNASPRFKSMLSTKFSEGVPPVVQINDIRYDIFQLVMQYLYKGGFENCEIDQNDVLELMAAASFFQLDGLLRFCESRSSKLVDLDNVVSMYIHAKVYNALYLLEYCQGFLLQNMVALLTYDDSVRKLIFGKKLHNHDVLSGLLLVLQTRVREKSPKSAAKS
ncbi:ankyrin repeat and BTB/POZ domain-containing protein 2-like [Argiope bruennichi]|uniref:Ankyrin repeat and BTB/POZ domain-containing n=2 Tax=Araneidae TaxID=6913 RepID=A0A8T0FMB9_ARGBR|nr:ankyrin repeat and BTB/POZ domain-containing protein 2-like [Argiope bruennichi]XP_055939424.1 ankyrin repeat and BTB/POZ domain-containing protein 2-like [Argiope bruennichi]XP_055939425.1 ankyrin repeat and BTB/POZ domain-containing protein 2-like [Argiope bruennichi]KAF8792334.1 Ankyrin repeat and BTB/POZ domain-containing [Argiope bruennichi]